MTDPINLQNVSGVMRPDETSDVAGAAGVTPSYITSEVTADLNVQPAVGIDSISVSSNIAGTQPTIGAEAVIKEDETGYIIAELEEQANALLLDNSNMNSLDEIENAYRYIDPQDPAVQTIISQLKADGVINDGMSQDEVMAAIHNYVIDNFSYIPEAAGDDWYTPSETVAKGGGDCEDLANLEASLFTAALLGMGLTIEEASARVNAMVIGDINTGTGHVYVTYVAQNGTVNLYDPALGGRSADYARSGMVVLFSYNSTGIRVLNSVTDYSMLVTGTIDFPADTTVGVNTMIDTVQASENRTEEIIVDVQELNAAITALNYDCYCVNQQAALGYAEDQLNTAHDYFYNTEHWFISLQSASENEHSYGVFDHPGLIFWSPGDWADMRTARDNYNDAVANVDSTWDSWVKSVNDYADLALKMGYLDQAAALAGISSAQYCNYIKTSSNFNAYDVIGYKYNNTSISATFYTYIYDNYPSYRSSLHLVYSPTPNRENTLINRYNAIHNAVWLYEIETTVRPLDSNVLEVRHTAIGDLITTDSSNTTAIFKKVDGYYTLRTDEEAPDSLFFLLKAEVDDLKGMLSVIALIHEARRDLRNLVNQELRGAEETGYKGMGVAVLFSKIVARVEQSLTSTMSGLLNMMNVLNNTLYLNECNSLNDYYNGEAERIEDNSDDLFDAYYWNGDSKSLENERDRNIALQGAAQSYKAATNANLAAAVSMFGSLGGDYDLESIIAGLNTLEVDTADATDGIKHTSVNMSELLRGNFSGGITVSYDSYHELDENAADDLRANLVGRMQARRIGAMAAEALAGMRNLVHQEMTGISGRQMRSDLIAEMIESESGNILMWFDQTIDLKKTSISLFNTIMEYDINIDKINKQIEEANKWYNVALNIFSKIVQAICVVAGAIVGSIFPVIGTGIGAGIGFLIGGMISNILSAARSIIMSMAFMDIEKSHNDVMKPTEYKPDLPVNVTTTTGNTAIDAANAAQNALNTQINDMTSGNFLIEQNNGNADFHGSYGFDGENFAAAQQNLYKGFSAMEVINSMRRANLEMRNLVHQEMTSIGGRGTSNFLTYAMEAARGQMAFQSDLAKYSIQTQEQSKNMEYARNRRIQQLSNNITSAVTSGLIGLIPVVGGVFSTYNSLGYQKSFYSQVDDAAMTTQADINDIESEELVNLINNGLIDKGDGRQTVNPAAIITAREVLTKGAIIRSVLASIREAALQMRSFTHMEMTGIGGLESTNVASKVNSTQFEGVMKMLDSIVDFLTDKAKIHNDALAAKQQVDKITQQMNNISIGTIIVAVLTAVLAMLGVPASYLLAGVQAAFSFINLLNAYVVKDWAEDRAEEDFGELDKILKTLKDAMNNTATSAENRMQKLEQQALLEIFGGMMQNLGGGMVGVNTGVGAMYKLEMDKLARTQKVLNKLSKIGQELRNQVHAAMTGISGAQVDSAAGVISMSLEAAKAKIDDALKLIESIAERTNEISDAKRELARAEVALIQAWFNFAISMINLAMKIDGVKGIIPEGVADAISKACEVYNYTSGICFAVLKRDALLQAEVKVETFVRDRGITSTEKKAGSAEAAMAARGGPMEIEDFTAIYEKEGGKAKLRTQALETKYIRRRIEREFKRDIEEALKALIKMLVKEKVDKALEPEAIVDENKPPESGGGKGVAAPAPKTEPKGEPSPSKPEPGKGVPAKDIGKTEPNKDVENKIKPLKWTDGPGKALGDAEDLLEKLKKTLEKIAEIMKTGGDANISIDENEFNNFIGMMKVEHSKANVSGLLAYADKQIDAANKAMAGKPAELAAAAGADKSQQKPTIQELKGQLEQAKAKLKAARDKLNEGMKMLAKLKGEIKSDKAKEQIALMEKKLQDELDNVNDDIGKIEAKEKQVGALSEKGAKAEKAGVVKSGIPEVDEFIEGVEQWADRINNLPKGAKGDPSASAQLDKKGFKELIAQVKNERSGSNVKNTLVNADKGIAAAEKAVVEGADLSQQKPTIEDLQKQLETAKNKLNYTKTKLKVAMEALAKIKGELNSEKAKDHIAAMEKALQEETDSVNKEIDKIEEREKKIKELSENIAEGGINWMPDMYALPGNK